MGDSEVVNKIRLVMPAAGSKQDCLSISLEMACLAGQETNFDRLPFYPRRKISSAPAKCDWQVESLTRIHPVLSKGFPSKPSPELCAKLLEALRGTEVLVLFRLGSATSHVAVLGRPLCCLSVARVPSLRPTL